MLRSMTGRNVPRRSLYHRGDGGEGIFLVAVAVGVEAVILYRYQYWERLLKIIDQYRNQEKQSTRPIASLPSSIDS